MDCFIMAGEHVYAEAAKSVPIRAKRRKFSDLRSHLLAFQAPYSKHWHGPAIVETAASVPPPLWG